MNKTGLFALITLIIIIGILISVGVADDIIKRSANDMSWEKISSNVLIKELNSNDIVIVDLREPELYKKSHIPNAINIPFEEIESRYGELDKNKKIIFVCHTGPMGEASSQLVIGEGYKNVANLQGGMAAWSGPIE